MPRVLYHKTSEAEKIVGPRLREKIRYRNRSMFDRRSLGSGKIFIDLAKLEQNPEIKTRLLLEAAKYVDDNNYLFNEVIFPLQRELIDAIYWKPESNDKNKLISLIRLQTLDFIKRARMRTKNKVSERYEKLVNLDCAEFFIALMGTLVAEYHNPKDLDLLKNVQKF